MQYFITYVLGHQSTSGKKAQLGTVVHKVMEVLAGCQHLQQDNKKMLLNDDALGDIKFTRKKLNSEEFVEDILKQSYDWYINIQREIISFVRTQLEKLLHTTRGCLILEIER